MSIITLISVIIIGSIFIDGILNAINDTLIQPKFGKSLPAIK